MEYVADVRVQLPGPLPEGYVQACSLRLQGRDGLDVLNSTNWAKALEGKVDRITEGAMVELVIYPFAAHP